MPPLDLAMHVRRDAQKNGFPSASPQRIAFSWLLRYFAKASMLIALLTRLGVHPDGPGAELRSNEWIARRMKDLKSTAFGTGVSQWKESSCEPCGWSERSSLRTSASIATVVPGGDVHLADTLPSISATTCAARRRNPSGPPSFLARARRSSSCGAGYCRNLMRASTHPRISLRTI